MAKSISTTTPKPVSKPAPKPRRKTPAPVASAGETGQPAPVQARPPRTIVLLSDGTGNSSSALFKTNVWRLYQALDLTDPNVQIAAYDDGVGTSTFKPLAIVGGAFGYGLKRNVQDLYAFLCRHYQPGDRIFVFGFSRGAFTARVLCGLITRIGIVKHDENDARREDKLDLAIEDAYLAYRKNFNQTGGLVPFLRRSRDKLICLKRRLFRQQQPREVQYHRNVPIEFIGVWDTVAAYGMPLDELTRAVDDWIWPLSMPNRILSPKVQRACHALAIDDERESFHPLLWTEEQHPHHVTNDDTSTSTHVDEERISQVWFPGVHCDVGGGYPDDAMAHVTLDWMMARLAAWQRDKGAGLRFLPGTTERFAQQANCSGLIHDSRRGLAGYFRYTPRSIASLTNRDNPRLARQKVVARAKALARTYKLWYGNTDLDEVYDRVRIARPKIHTSVFDRIRSGADGYAPFTLPKHYALVDTEGRIIDHKPESAPQAEARCTHQEAVWNTVWKRRVTYFATVGASLWLAAFPIIPSYSAPRACNSGVCVIVPVLDGIGSFLPGVFGFWLDAFARRPGWFLIALGLLLGLLSLGAILQRRIRDCMRPGWAAIAPVYQSAQLIPAGPMDGLIGKLRNSKFYKGFFLTLKFDVAPIAFAALFAGVIATGVVLTSLVAYERYSYWRDARSGRICAEPQAGAPSADLRLFLTRDPCFDTGVQVAKGGRYRMTLTITEAWTDHGIPADPRGFAAQNMAQRFATPLLRAVGEPYFRPIARVGGVKGRELPLVFTQNGASSAANVFTAEFVAPHDGQLYLFVNDAINLSALNWMSSRFNRWRFVDNNTGAARVSVSPLPPR